MTASGDQRSFDDFFESTHSAVRARAIMLCGHRANAEDAVQEAYLEALLRWDKIGGYERPVAWVHMVMAQRLWKGYSVWAATADVDAEDIPVYDGPEQALAAREILLCLKERLPPRERFALVAHCLQGFSQQEVADVMKVTRSAVAASIRHARLKLAPALGYRQAERRLPESLVGASGPDRRVQVSPVVDPLTAMLVAAEAAICNAIEAEPAAAAEMLASIRARAAAVPPAAASRPVASARSWAVPRLAGWVRRRLGG